jgi:hypothetical protein
MVAANATKAQAASNNERIIGSRFSNAIDDERIRQRRQKIAASFRRRGFTLFGAVKHLLAGWC